MGYSIYQGQTAQPLCFFLASTADGVTGVTGLSPTVTLSKNGGAFASPAGAVTEIGNGWYKVAGNATDSATLGPLLLRATGTAANPCNDQFVVVDYDMQDSVDLGLSGLGGGGVALEVTGTTREIPATIAAYELLAQDGDTFEIQARSGVVSTPELGMVIFKATAPAAGDTGKLISDLKAGPYTCTGVNLYGRAVNHNATVTFVLDGTLALLD